MPSSTMTSQEEGKTGRKGNRGKAMEPLVERGRKSKISIRIRILSIARFIPVPVAPSQGYRVQHEYIESLTPLFCPSNVVPSYRSFQQLNFVLYAFFSPTHPCTRWLHFQPDKTGADDKGGVGGSGPFNSEKGLVHLHSIQGPRSKEKKRPPSKQASPAVCAQSFEEVAPY